jgi:hypothetical protein
MKQTTLFEIEQEEEKYSSIVDAPVYVPSGKKPHHLELCDVSKTKKLIKEIDESSISKEDKEFLKYAAQRHIVFNYQLIANYYANSCKEVQELMEKSSLIIIDFNKAIENGFVKICEDLKKQYLEEYCEK